MELFIKKEIKFSAGLDTTEFDRVIAEMQRKLEKMTGSNSQAMKQNQTANRAQSSGVSGNMSTSSQQEIQRSTMQARRNIEQGLSAEIKIQEKLSKEMKEQTKLVENLQKIKSASVKNSEQELNIIKSITSAEAVQAQQRQRFNAQDVGINKLMDARNSLKPQGLERLSAAYQGGGLSGAATAAGRMMSNLNPLQVIGAGVGAADLAAKALRGYGDFQNTRMNAQGNTAQSTGSAASGFYGRDLSASYNGRSSIENSYTAEKAKAMNMANEGIAGARKKAEADAISRQIETVAKYTAAGAAIGGIATGTGPAIAAGALTFGTGAIPAFGAAAVPGAITGGRIGAAVGSARAAMDNSPGSYKAVFGDGVEHDQYEADMARDHADKYVKNLQGVMDSDPRKRNAKENYHENYMRYLDTQRSMGMNNSDFYEMGSPATGISPEVLPGYRQKAINAGFHDDMAMDASNRILGAGGSTSMAKDSTLSLQASRNFNQTNASGVLGQVSGQLGGAQASQQAYIKMLAEGTRQGLDTSTYAEESRKMMEVQAGALAKSGATSTSDVERLVSQMGGFLAEKTNKGVESAKNAFDTYNQASGQTEGPRGVLRASGFIKDSILGKMKPDERASLASMTEDQLSTSDPMIIEYAKKYDTSPEKIISSIKQVNKNSLNMRKNTDDARDTAIKMKAKLQNKMLTDPERDKTQDEYDSAMGTLNKGIQLDFPNQPLQQRLAMANAQVNDPATAKKMAEDYKKLDTERQNKDTGKMEDKTVLNGAEGAREVLIQFTKFKDQMVPAAESVRLFNIQFNKMLDAIEKFSPEERNRRHAEMGFKGTETQGQAGKTKN